MQATKDTELADIARSIEGYSRIFTAQRGELEFGDLVTCRDRSFERALVDHADLHRAAGLSRDCDNQVIFDRKRHGIRCAEPYTRFGNDIPRIEQSVVAELAIAPIKQPLRFA